MLFSGMLRRTALVRTDVSEKQCIHHQDDKNPWSVLTRTTRRNIPEDGILDIIFNRIIWFSKIPLFFTKF
jgi:hypothetical protein